MISTLIGTSSKTGGFAVDFNKICNGTLAPPGCAMLAFEVYGGNNRAVNKYSYQPSSTPAFSNTMYNSKTMYILTRKPPTQLIEV